nr:glycosyltransferase [Neobacillus muris]
MRKEPLDWHETISVIIPARNEEKNMPELLESLLKQSIKIDELIVVDDHSEDRTKTIAESYGVNVFTAPELPDGWTGKTWAVWNGYLQSHGETLVFLDADIRLAETAIQSLLLAQKNQGGVLSVVPCHITEKFYEKFAMVLNLLGVFAFTSPFEARNKEKGLYGACIVAKRADYDKIGGHQRIRSEMLDDLNLGASFQNAGIKVTNYIGHGLVSFRMYPGGFKSELEGFAKGAVLSTASLNKYTLFTIILWILGLIVSPSWFFLIGHPVFFPLFIGYILYAVEMIYINRFVGRFGLIHPVFHFLSVIFFLIVVAYSLYQAVFRKKVIWKGRYIRVRGDKS